jgi:hypothetical protein
MSWSFQYPVCQVELAVKSIVSPLNARLTVMEKACHRSSSGSLVVVVSVGSVSVGVVVLKEDGLVGKVTSEGDGGDTEARERALESVPAREGASVSPGLAVELRQREDWIMTDGVDVLSGPGVVSRLARGGSELLRVETSEIGTRSHDMRSGDGLL